MKKLMLIIIAVLGMVMCVSSCDYFPYYYDGYYDYDYPSYDEGEGEMTRNGTLYCGDSFHWRNMSIELKGYIVEVYRNGYLVRQFDVRRCYDVDAEYYPIGFQGQALYVNLVLKGVGGTNYLVVKGVVDEFYNLY